MVELQNIFLYKLDMYTNVLTNFKGEQCGPMDRESGHGSGDPGSIPVRSILSRDFGQVTFTLACVHPALS